MWSAALSGLALGGSLIVALGAQNAFVIRQGILGRHVFWVCLFCAFSDALLIAAGTLGLGSLLKLMPWLLPVMTYGGAAFLLAYGLKALLRVFSPAALTAADAPPLSLAKTLSICAAFTFLNPHVYLDTVILIGSLANSQPQGMAWAFAAGASLASFIWFFTLGFGTGALRHILSRPSVWRIIDLLIAAIMFYLAIRLLIA